MFYKIAPFIRFFKQKIRLTGVFFALLTKVSVFVRRASPRQARGATDASGNSRALTRERNGVGVLTHLHRQPDRKTGALPDRPYRAALLGAVAGHPSALPPHHGIKKAEAASDSALIISVYRRQDDLFVEAAVATFFDVAAGAQPTGRITIGHAEETILRQRRLFVRDTLLHFFPCLHKKDY